MAAVAMNILRLIGQNTLVGKDAPLRHKAKRTRVRQFKPLSEGWLQLNQ
jgi:hypothetical protein